MNTTWSGAMDLSAGLGSTGGAVYLKNSAAWTNYAMTAAVDWLSGQTIGLMADYSDASNYILCGYTKTGSSTVVEQLFQYRDGNEVPLSPAATVPRDDGSSTISLSIEVSGVYGTCLLDGQSVSNSGIGPGRAAMASRKAAA